MKRPPNFSSSPSSSSSSSSSSCVGSDDQIAKKPIKTKRPRKDNQPINVNGNNINASSPNSSGRRSSIYRGVTRHRWTGRFEAHLWDKGSWNNVQNKKGRQVYLGAYDSEEAAARTYDLAALKYWGPETILNFPIENYKKDVEEMQKVSKEEYLASLRRSSSGFSRGVSKYRGVARHHHNGRWEARIGRVFGNKYLYLGTYSTQEEAAAAYDMAALEHRGANAVTNFDVSRYVDRLKEKGIFILDQNQDPLLYSSTESEVEQPRPQPQPQPQPQPEQQQQTQPTLLLPEQIVSAHHQAFQYPQLPSCADTTNCAMTDEHELSWSFYLDSTVGLTPLLVPDDIPFGNAGDDELLDLFDDTGFEDNIDFIFDDADLQVVSNNGNEGGAGSSSSNKYMECALDVTSCGGVTVNMQEEDNGKLLVVSSATASASSNLSSPSSSTTSVSCSNYFV